MFEFLMVNASSAIELATDEIGGIVMDLTSGIMGMVTPILLLAGGIFVIFFGWKKVKTLIKGAK